MISRAIRAKIACLLVSSWILLLAPTGNAQTAAATSWDRFIDGLSAYGFCKTLASNEFEGRLTGDPGYDRAASWIAGQFKNWGLQPGVSEGYLQPFPMQVTTVRDAGMTLWFPAADPGSSPREQKLEVGRDFLPLIFADSSDRTGDIVFVGFTAFV